MNNLMNKDWVKWLLVLPVVFGVWSVIQLLLAFLITAPFYSNLMELFYGPYIIFLKEFTFYAIAPYWAILVGALTAPNYNFKVALALATLIAVIYVFSASTVIFLGAKSPLWITAGTIMFLIAAILACIHAKRESKLKN